MTPLILDYDVVWEDEFAVHAGVQLLSKQNDTNIAANKNVKPGSLTQAINNDIKRRADSDHSNDNDDIKHKNARKATRLAIQQCMDKHIDANIDLLQMCAQEWQSSRLWRTIAKCIDRAIINTTDTDPENKST